MDQKGKEQMQFQLKLDIAPLEQRITYKDKILLVGSCFTEHMSERLSQRKFTTLSNPHGIIFNPMSVASSLRSYLEEMRYGEADLFYLNELWNSWEHHTRFSDTSRERALTLMNTSQSSAATFIREADWIFVTLGSAFQYYMKDGGIPVANNHRAPAQWFDKQLLGIETIQNTLMRSIADLRQQNPGVKVMFTVSPVRHIRDGVVENNRSKARLLEAVHAIACEMPEVYYFPAYELVIDVLRDYRYYDIDLVHPNYAATQYVWEQFALATMDEETRTIMAQVQDIVIARNHRTRFAETNAHRQFLLNYKTKAEQLMARYPFLDLRQEIRYFAG